MRDFAFVVFVMTPIIAIACVFLLHCVGCYLINLFRAALVLLAISLCLPAQAQTYGNQRVQTTAGSQTLVTMTAQGAGTQDSPDFTNSAWRGVVVFVNISAVTGTVSVVPVVQGRDPVSGVYYDICVGTARTGTGLFTVSTYPSAVASGGVICNAILPITWRIEMRHGAGVTPATTGTVSANMLM
jgi:hypothetical protein